MKKLKEAAIKNAASHQTVQPKLAYNAPLFEVLIDINKTAKQAPIFPEQTIGASAIGHVAS